MDYTRIPAEMKQFAQWLCWRYEDRDGSDKPTKIPYNPLSGRLASVIDPSTWCDYSTAVACVANYSGIGFVLTKDDPYSFIDLDDTQGNAEWLARQRKIFSEFDSYSERSPSGNGLHIIVRGALPNGRRRSSVEVYSDERYMTMTGAVFHDRPIEDRSELLRLLWDNMGAGRGTVPASATDVPQTESDMQIIEKGVNAHNSDKFRDLMDGRWQHRYNSQSEADFALIDIIAFYTQNTDQIARIFRNSALGARDKANRIDYINRMILSSFDRILPEIDLDIHLNDIEDNKYLLKSMSGGAPDAVSAEPDMLKAMQGLLAFCNDETPQLPPGLLGEIALYSYSASVRPVPEASLAAAIAMLAGICGRAYNISGTGLNQYILFLATTGVGKEAISKGIGRLMSHAATLCPAITNFRGPAEMGSGQALLNHINDTDNRCFVSIMGEFGLKLKSMSDKRATATDIMLKKVLLDLYNKSGAGDAVAPYIYADKKKNTSFVKSPAVTLIGESTPVTFYGNLDEGSISDGLLPRFLAIEYTGERPYINKNHHTALPSDKLLTSIGEVATYCMSLGQMEKVIEVRYTPEAEQFLDKMNEIIDHTIRATKKDILVELWNRSHLKTLKLAALVAVGCNFVDPVITIEHAKWSYNMVMSHTMQVVNRFIRGEIGSGVTESSQTDLLLRIIVEYLTDDYVKVMKYRVPKKIHDRKVIPYSYMSRRISSSNVFKEDKFGATAALKRTIQILVDNGDLKEIPKHESEKNFGTTGRLFVISSVGNIADALG